MVIDGHAHACGDFLTIESITRKLDELKVDKVVLVPGELGSSKNLDLPNLGKTFPNSNIVKSLNVLTKIVIRITGKLKEIPEGNEYVYQLAKNSKGRVLQSVWLTQLESDPLGFLDEKYKSWNFHGIKLHQCWESFSVKSKFFKEVAQWAEENAVPVFIHLYSKREAKELLEYKKIHPNLVLIVAHLFALDVFLKNHIQDDNLYFDISAFQVVSDIRLIKAIKEFGASHITLGSDTPYGNDSLRKSIKRIKNLEITEGEKSLILGDNLKRIHHLEK